MTIGTIGNRSLRGCLTALLALIFCFGITTTPASAQEAPEPAQTEAVAAKDSHAEHHGLPEGAPVIYDGEYFKINSSMVISWIAALFLIVFAKIATSNIKQIPSGAQNFWEWLIESLYSFLEGIMGHDLVKKTFWFFATVFLFILATNWFSLIPGVGTIGWGIPDENGALHHLTHPVLRGGNADFNMTLAMSMVFFVCWTVWALQSNGPGGFLHHIFGSKGKFTGAMAIGMALVFLAVGFLEVVSILFRPVSLSFRLFGNIFAGENLLETMAAKGGMALGWLFPLPFYFMELLVGVVQALVFTLLTAVFTLLICSHEESH